MRTDGPRRRGLLSAPEDRHLCFASRPEIVFFFFSLYFFFLFWLAVLPK